MVGIVIVSHSYNLTKYLIEFLEIFKTSDFEIVNGSDENQAFGTSVEKVETAIKKADKGSGVLLFVDLGSSIDIALKAMENLNGVVNTQIADSPLIEGSISAVAANDEDISLSKLKVIAEDSINFRKIK
ncbi:PTS-dependent dihydroxyacetone kinase phosphotransferase subunit DhaM [Oceanivirga salmonicida]|uniref:PTS-dependent dihydroxyacetone kinase phosphotransferase subunit DhaM n=1 Tax=Oceanivirga salmonicida TaxID=1769291 RepID=UPI0008319784|nr:diguanylate cyclase [Oceanivirga salmonicida]